MGTGSSAHATEVEAYDRRASDAEDPDAVATPLRPAYAPTPSPAPPASLSSGSFGANNASPFNPAFERELARATAPLWPSPPPTAPAPSTLPFQPPPQPYAHNAHARSTHMSYYPLELGSPGVVLSRVVRVLEATPPPYLLLPEHPHVPPTLPLPAPPAPPNTAQGRRFNSSFPASYPGCGKGRDVAPTLGPGTGLGVVSRMGGRPPTSS
ncbi:vegetative cell wall protein gp1-like [Penaeus japonicus]|uniref:vegetative cell wall protein gp1-like n=1 Tax=Penaeus japonicus TaxID=27405 RepID=UPI001C70DBC1|nr:vegetative cell wall protein gp1-like [Penaeus japonicus]